MELLKPTLDHLPGYKAALEKDWGPNTKREIESAREELQQIAQDAAAFVDSMDDPEAKAGPIKLPDGSRAQRLPGFRRWMWDGEFCGNIGFRWQPGTPELPPHCLGHIGYSVVPWKQKRGYATQALKLLLQEIRPYGLPYIEITVDPENAASQKVVLSNGGIFLERFRRPPAYGSTEALRYRINL